MTAAHSSDDWKSVLRDAALVVIGATSIGLLVNALRPTGAIPLVQKEPYDLVVPCPEPVGEAQPIAPTDPRLLERNTLVIDARSRSDYDVSHLPHAINKPFDWLGPPVGEELSALSKQVAGSKARLVVVYGDGEDPDSGREWARLLAGGGIKNVFFVVGGAPALAAKLAPNVRTKASGTDGGPAATTATGTDGGPAATTATGTDGGPAATTAPANGTAPGENGAQENAP